MIKSTIFAVCVVLFTQTASFSADGKASYYGNEFVGRKTASGQLYSHNKLTAAHKTLRFGTKVRVTNVRNGKSVVVVINDRGPFIKGRIIDLSKSAAAHIGIIRSGVGSVRVTPLSK